MSKDITGTLGATNHSTKEREKNDYYGTNPAAVDKLLAKESFSILEPIWEPTAGHHNIVNMLEKHGYNVFASDLIDYDKGDTILDFLATEPGQINFGDIVMNPPYKLANEFVEHALKVSRDGSKIACFLRLSFLEGQARYKNIFSINPPKTIYVFSKRQVCSKTDDWTEPSAVAYCWMIWEKGYTGSPELRWL